MFFLFGEYIKIVMILPVPVTNGTYYEVSGFAFVGYGMPKYQGERERERVPKNPVPKMALFEFCARNAISFLFASSLLRKTPRNVMNVICVRCYSYYHVRYVSININVRNICVCVTRKIMYGMLALTLMIEIIILVCDITHNIMYGMLALTLTIEIIILVCGITHNIMCGMLELPLMLIIIIILLCYCDVTRNILCK